MLVEFITSLSAIGLQQKSASAHVLYHTNAEARKGEFASATAQTDAKWSRLRIMGRKKTIVAAENFRYGELLALCEGFSDRR